MSQENVHAIVEEEPDLSLFIRFKRTESFDGEGRLESERCIATIQYRQPWRQPSVMQMADGAKMNDSPDTRPWPRLIRALEEQLGCDNHVKTEDESPPIEVHHYPDKHRIEVIDNGYSDGRGIHGLMSAVNWVARDWRNGELTKPPVVDAEDHKEMVEHGIKVRKDGLFGYKRLCANEACENRTNTCYGNTTLYRAVKGAQKRSYWSCSHACWMKSQGLHIEDINPDWQYDVHDMLFNEHTAMDEDDAKILKTYEAVSELMGGFEPEAWPEHIWGDTNQFGTTYCTNCHKSKERNQHDRCATGRLTWSEGGIMDIADKDPALWEDFLAAVFRHEDGGYGEDGGQVGCEI